MSFAATVSQMRDGSKTVTRRDPGTWANLEPGDRVLAIEKGMGLKKGERQTPIGVIEIVDNRVEHVADLTVDEVALEGFPGMTPEDFLTLVWQPMHPAPIRPITSIRRIEFVHVPQTASQSAHQ